MKTYSLQQQGSGRSRQKLAEGAAMKKDGKVAAANDGSDTKKKFGLPKKVEKDEQVVVKSDEEEELEQRG